MFVSLPAVRYTPSLPGYAPNEVVVGSRAVYKSFAAASYSVICSFIVSMVKIRTSLPKDAPTIPVEGSNVRLSSGAIFTKGNISTILLPPYCSSSFGQSPDHLTDAACSTESLKNALNDINHPIAPITAITHQAL